MAEKMKAVVKTKRAEGAQFVEVDIPKPAPDQVLVKVKATSICGTDVHIYQWDEWSQGRIKNIPQILGHELAGEVVEAGKSVTKAKVGDYVLLHTGYAINVIDPVEAEETLKLLKELSEVY